MSDAEVEFLDAPQDPLTEMARRLSELAASQDALTAAISRERHVQRETLLLLTQLFERHAEGLRRVEGGLAELRAGKDAGGPEGAVMGQLRDLAQSLTQSLALAGQLAARAQEQAKPRRVATVKSKVVVMKPKKPASPPVSAPPRPARPAPAAPPPPPIPEGEIEQQISEAIGNISAMLKRKTGRRRKGE